MTLAAKRGQVSWTARRFLAAGRKPVMRSRMSSAMPSPSSGQHGAAIVGVGSALRNIVFKI